MDKKLRVVWVTHVSNQKIRKCLVFKNRVFVRIVRYLIHRPRTTHKDMSQWITNGLTEYEKCQEVELHLVAPHVDIIGLQEFVLDGIHYHFFGSESNCHFIRRMFRKPKLRSEFSKNRKVIQQLIEQINPDVVHVIGAENPQYSLVTLDINTEKIPLIVSLQTLMSAPDFKDNYFLKDEVYNYRSDCERRIIQHSKYIGSKSSRFKEIIWNEINPNAIFLNTTLFVGEEIHRSDFEKKYDVIYFAKDIAKAADIVLNVMSELRKSKAETKMCIVGGCNVEYKVFFESMLDNLDLRHCIDYLGCLPTHDDVLQSVRSAKVALLPVKIESITGTMREAMANGVPIVTTETWGTPILNEKRKTALIKEQNDFKGLARAVLTLLEDKKLYTEIKENGFLMMEERYSNAAFMKTQNEIYYSVVNHQKNGTPIPEDLCDRNNS